MSFRRPPTTSPAGRALSLVESRLGVSVQPRERVEIMEAVVQDYGAQNRMLDLLGWTVLDHFSGREQEVKYESRKSMARKARYAWIHDPLVGGAVSLMNDFVLGRGVPKPRCNDSSVQERVDEAWDDPDNKSILTDFLAQIALNTDLSLQSNLLFLLFDDGDDGRVKLSTLNYDAVEDAITDPENRHRVLWYVAREAKSKWDFKEDKWKIETEGVTPKKLYYEHWHNVKDAEEEGAREEPLDKPDDSKMGKGRVYHVAINRTTEMVFGVPEWVRVLRWANAYSDFMKSRVDMTKAAAAFVMRAKTTGSPTQVARMAAKVAQRGPLGAGYFPQTPDDPAPAIPPRRYGAALYENEGITHESFKLDSGASNAQLDAANLRSQFSAASRWPQHYLGAGDGPGLATATSLELPILKMVETRQEILEGIYRWFIDRVIERAVESGHIKDEVEDSEREGGSQTNTLSSALAEASENGERAISLFEVPKLRGKKRQMLVTYNRKTGENVHRVVFADVQETHEDKTDDERDTQRDLGYTFSLPSPLRRMMSDLISSISQIAQTIDPNNTNVKLSRTLLYVALGEGLELENAAELVDEIIPEDYVDPMIAAAQAQQGGGGQPNFFGPDFEGADGQQHGEGNPYGAPMKATMPERVPGAQEAVYLTRRRNGSVVRHILREGRLVELPEDVQTEVSVRERATDSGWENVVAIAEEELLLLTTTGGNGNGNERD